MRIFKLIFSNIIGIIILCVLNSCKTIVFNNYECNTSYGLDESNLGDFKVRFIKNSFSKDFYYFQYSVERCPGYLSTNCYRFYNFYSEEIPQLSQDIKESNNCFFLSESQIYILPFRYYKSFIEKLPDSTIKEELITKLKQDLELNSVEEILIEKIKKSKLTKIYFNNVSIYEFEVNTEQLNYYYPPTGALYTYCDYPHQNTKILILITEIL